MKILWIKLLKDSVDNFCRCCTQLSVLLKFHTEGKRTFQAGKKNSGKSQPFCSVPFSSTWNRIMGQFQVAFCLNFKTSLWAKPFK